MQKSISLVIVVVIVVGALYWAFNSTRVRSYNGANLTFAVGTGNVVVTNSSDVEIPVSMRSEGRTANFRVASSDFDLNLNSSRKGSGRTVYHGVEFNLPPGQSQINVTRGSNVQFISSSSTRITAVVTPMSAEQANTTFIITAGIVLASLFFASHVTEHQWVRMVQSKLPMNGRELKNA